MNARRGDSPERLLKGDASDFERRVLEQALARGPSKELTQRMATALGVGVTALAAPPSEAAQVQVPPPGGSTSTLTWVWLSAAVVTASVAAVVGVRASKEVRSTTPAPRIESKVGAQPVTPMPDVMPAPPSVSAALGSNVRVPAQAAAELRGEIELLDSARAAVAQNASGRALQILGRYENRYPAGRFGPEATAVKVEALMHLGRTDEARALAARFVAKHPGMLLADRVAAVAGLSRP
jgi:hypothetical protein